MALRPVALSLVKDWKVDPILAPYLRNKHLNWLGLLVIKLVAREREHLETAGAEFLVYLN